MRIHIEVVPAKAMRYASCGDWQFVNGDLYIQVSAMGDWRYEALVGVHEACEALLCRHRGIDQSEVDQFDLKFEAARPASNTDEPGDSPDAPYRAEHFAATNIERLLAAELKVDWREYDKTVASL